MELNGLRINFLGDSITAGAKASDRDRLDYVHLISAKTGAVCRNYGVGGTRISRQEKPDLEHPRRNLDFCYRAKIMHPLADVVFIFGGTNDYGSGTAELGTDTDRTPYTFYGALHYLYSIIKERYPGVRVIVATPIKRAVVEKKYRKLRDYVDAVIKVANQYNFTILNLYDMEELDFHNNVKLREEYLDPDGLHPNDKGHELLSNVIIDFLKSV